MAKLVTIIGITHNPFMPRLFQQPQQPPGTAKVKERIAMMRQKLAEAKPDVLITIGNDHLHQFFMDNMPPFMIGKMDAYDGTFYDETREFGLPTCKLPGEPDLSDHILECALDEGVDFSYSNELTIDHSIIVPMMFVRPEMDIPIVPILTNCIAPPMPRPKRFYEVGIAIRKAIDSIPGDRRVGVLVSGHLSLEVGGPRQFERHLMDPQFDADAVGWIQHGDIKSAAEGCTPARMMKAGNMTTRLSEFPHDDGRGEFDVTVLCGRLGRRISRNPFLQLGRREIMIMDWRVLTTVFTSVFVAELGDKTQLATMLFASDKDASKLTVFAGAALALVVTSAIGVAAGSAVSQYVSEKTLQYVAGIGFIAIGIWTLLKA